MEWVTGTFDDRPGKTSCYRLFMRTTGTVTISLPPELAIEVDRMAHQEGRTAANFCAKRSASTRSDADDGISSLRMEKNERLRRPD